MKKNIFLFLSWMLSLIVAAQSPISVNVTVTQLPCHNDGKMYLNIFGGTPPYEITWIHNSQFVNGTDSLVNAHPGFYFISVTDAAQNYGFSNFLLPGSFNLSANFVDANCPAIDGAVYLQASGGIAPYTFSWNTGITTIDTAGIDSLVGISSGYYYSVVYDSTGCYVSSQDISNSYVNSIAPIQVTFQIKEDSCNDGAIKATASGSAPPFTYSWPGVVTANGDSAYGLDVGVYSLVVMDTNLCSATFYPYVHPDSLHLQSYATSTSAVCPAYNNGSITTNVYSGVPPYAIQWSNGATTFNLTNLPPGPYSAIITDSRGCHNNTYHYVSGVSNTNVMIDSLENPDCSNLSGSISVSGSGIGPVHFSWNTGDTTATINNLASGAYSVSVTDSAGCSTTSPIISLILPDSCYAHINGTVYNDMNADCALNGSESGIPNRIIQLSNGEFISTAFFGEYHYKTLNFGNTNISHLPPNGWNLVCPLTSYSVVNSANSMANGIDFYDYAPASNDLVASCIAGLPRPGFTHRSYFAIKNAGTTTQSGSIQFKPDAIEQFMGASNGVSFNPVSGILTANLPVLPPDAYYVYWADFSIPATTTLGTAMAASVLVSSPNPDATPLDNADTSHTIVVGSYDPNDKMVEPSNEGDWLYPGDSVLTYTVRFQNTGNYPTTFITLIDTLDADLNIPSFEFMGASHPGCTWSINGPGVITFKFDSIQLEGASINEPASHGFISYRIKIKPNPAHYTKYTNTAYIYFDYNAPIVTNTTNGIVYPSVTLGAELTAIDTNFKLWPNPGTGQFNLAFKNADATRKISVHDMLGRTVYSGEAGSVVNVIDCSAFETGAYVVTIFVDGKKTASEKLFITR